MRKYQSKLTKEDLQNWGITNVTEDGHVFVDDKEVKYITNHKKGKYKNQKSYITVLITDKSKKIYRPEYGKGYWNYSQIIISLHRIVYAWFYGEVPEGMDVDHIDNDPLNNNINNLQLLSRKDNNGKKKYSRNQYNYNLSDEEIEAKRATKKYVYDRELGKAVKADWWVEALEEKRAKKAEDIKTKKDLFEEWHKAIDKCRMLQKERVKAKKDRDIVRWRALGKELAEQKIQKFLILEKAREFN